jgi:hypothetical protein
VFVLFSGLNGNSKHIIDIKLEDNLRKVEVLLKWWGSSTTNQGSSASQKLGARAPNSRDRAPAKHQRSSAQIWGSSAVEPSRSGRSFVTANDGGRYFWSKIAACQSVVGAEIHPQNRPTPLGSRSL